LPPLLVTSFRLTGDSVINVLKQACVGRRKPPSIPLNHGTEFTSKALDSCAWKNAVVLDFTSPGQPTKNALCESFNGRLQDECINVNEFVSMACARKLNLKMSI
jgi:putative transposase